MTEALTRSLAGFAVGPAAALPPRVTHEAARAFVNYVGCALGGLDEPSSLHTLALADEFSGARVATVIGRPTRLDAQHAALLNCLQSSVQTFDDTHLASVLHPTGPAAAAAFALRQHPPGLEPEGADFLAALACGIEVACRVAVAMTAPPSRMALGAFTTGIVGGIGAAVSCARLLRLDAQRMEWAIGLAAAQGCGIRATHATMAGALVPAVGARAGLAAALLAARGFDCGDAALEGSKGLFEVFAPGADPQLALEGLGSRFELDALAYKPYPCGIVVHAAIDACLDALREAGGEPVASAVLQVPPLTLQLASTRHPPSALACNVSLFHWAAAALVRGRAGVAEASESALHEPAIVAMRDRIDARADDTLRREEAIAELRLASGRVVRAHVPHARGSRERPLTQAELEAKFLAQAEPRLGAARAAGLLAHCNGIAASGPGWVEVLASLAVPA
jgi:2-methylcitrate dehydratase PrpD